MGTNVGEAGVLSAAVVGAGSGGMLSIRGLQASQRYRLVGVADWSEVVREKIAGELPGVALYPDAESLLGSLHPDVVCVSTFAPAHTEVLRQALDAGARAVLLEKPIALAWADGRRALDLLESRRAPVVVPHGLLVRGASEEVLRRVSAGDIGEVEVVEIECTGWDLINAGTHWVDFALAILRDDPVVSVLCAGDVSTRTYRDDIEVETEAVTYCVTQSGARVVMHTGDDVKMAREGKGVVYRVYGDRGSIEFWGWEDRYSSRGGEPGPVMVEVPSGEATAHQVYLEMLADMLDKGVPEYELAELSLNALEVCEAAYLSYRHGCAVRLPLAQFTPPGRSDWDPGAHYRGKGGRNGRQL